MPATPKKTGTGTTKYRYTGTHVADMEGGRPLAPGDYVDLSETDLIGHTREMVDMGYLIDANDMSDEQMAGEVPPGQVTPAPAEAPATTTEEVSA